MARLLKDLQINEAMPKYGIVYKVTCTVSGKSYIGITRQSLMRRWNAHVLRALNNLRGASALAAAIRKYGKDSFTVTELTSEPSYARLIQAEQEWIAYEGTQSPGGYNLTSGGEGALNPSSETRAKLRASRLGKKQSPELIAKRTSRQLGRKRSPEAIKKARIKQLGVKRESWGNHTADSIAKMKSAFDPVRRKNPGAINAALSMGA
ncbi:MAG TPA: GIY-YIG nuclease family protein [Candidatus Acidoferrales bacterium]|nr:GIY-YIG nuclease family protein [Candidatus Acidoferrales bacterium]